MLWTKFERYCRNRPSLLFSGFYHLLWSSYFTKPNAIKLTQYLCSYPPSFFAQQYVIQQGWVFSITISATFYLLPHSFSSSAHIIYNLQLLKHEEAKFFFYWSDLFSQEYLLWNEILTVAHFYWIESLKLKKNEVLDAFIVWAGVGRGQGVNGADLIAQPHGF